MSVHPDYDIKQEEEGSFKGKWTCKLEINGNYLYNSGSWGDFREDLVYFESDDDIWLTLAQKDEDDHQAYLDNQEDQYWGWSHHY